MEKREFHTVGELEDVSNALARATEHPLFVDFGTSGTEADPDGPVDPEPYDAKHVIWNERDDVPAYVATSYTLVQHREMIDMIRSAVGDTVGSIDKGVIRDWGAKIDGTLVFGNQEDAKIDVGDLVDTDYVVPEGIQTRDELGLGMRFSNSFDGSSKIHASTMGYRYICGNWMVWGEETIGMSETRHVGDIDESFFAELVHEVFDVKSELEGIVASAESEELPTEWIPGLLEEAGFGRNYQKRIAKRAYKQKTAKEDETTMWRLYNAITSELDNNAVEKVQPHTYNGHQQKAWDILESEPDAPQEVEPLAEFVGEA